LPGAVGTTDCVITHCPLAGAVPPLYVRVLAVVVVVPLMVLPQYGKSVKLLKVKPRGSTRFRPTPLSTNKFGLLTLMTRLVNWPYGMLFPKLIATVGGIMLVAIAVVADAVCAGTLNPGYVFVRLSVAVSVAEPPTAGATVTTIFSEVGGGSELVQMPELGSQFTDTEPADGSDPVQVIVVLHVNVWGVTLINRRLSGTGIVTAMLFAGSPVGFDTVTV